MVADSTSLAPRPAVTRSRVSNGTRLLEGVDGRSAGARRFRDLCRALAADLGGEPGLTEAEKLTVRSAAALQVHAEAMQARIVRGEDVSPDEVVRLMNASTRTLAALRTKRQARKPVSADPLADYLASKAAAEVAA